jgi:hypothetical protein
LCKHAFVCARARRERVGEGLVRNWTIVDRSCRYADIAAGPVRGKQTTGRAATQLQR